MSQRGGAADWSVAAANAASGVGTLVLCVLHRDTLPIHADLARTAGLLAIYGGLAIAGWAAFHLGSGIYGLVLPRTILVTTGPYRWIRHPVYAGTTVAMIGVAAVTRSGLGLLAVLLVFLPSEIHRARLEERALAAAFGSAWEAYRSRTLDSRVSRRRDEHEHDREPVDRQ